MSEYLSANQRMWDDRAPAHAASPSYRVEELIQDATLISDVVRFDAPRLGDIGGLATIHLQCHIGTDTISLHRLGASVTGLDFSAASLEQARRLAIATSSAVEFIESDVYEAVAALGAARFDLVYTGVGALCWLPDIRRWAQVVFDLLKPSGRLFIREGHPMLWAVGDSLVEGFPVLNYPYFERTEPDRDDTADSYVATDATFTDNESYSWNHGIAEIITAVTDAGLSLHAFEEHDTVPWDAIPGGMCHVGHGEYQLIERPWRLAHSYTLQAIKRP